MTAAEPVLIVEDDEDILETLRLALESEGYRVLGVGSGQAALAQLQAERPRLILLDLRMPGMSGPQFRAEQLKDASLATIPVVLLSADAAVAKIAASLQVADYLRKPFKLSELLLVVARYYS